MPQQGPPPEMVVIRRARLARGLSLDEAASGVAELSGTRFSASRWSQLETGYRVSASGTILQLAKDGRLAQMAYVVGVAPEQLERAGRQEAAEVLRELIRQKRSGEAGPATSSRGAPSPAEIADWFRNTDVPIAERRRVAERFLDVLPYLMRGQEPPPDAMPAAEQKRDPA